MTAIEYDKNGSSHKCMHDFGVSWAERRGGIGPESGQNLATADGAGPVSWWGACSAAGLFHRKVLIRRYLRRDGPEAKLNSRRTRSVGSAALQRRGPRRTSVRRMRCGLHGDWRFNNATTTSSIPVRYRLW